MHSILFHYGFITIYAYGTMLSLAILAGGYLAVREADREGISRDAVLDFILYASIAGLLGSRILYILLDIESYLAEPIKIFALRDGGLSFHGAVLGGAATGVWFIRKYKISYGRLADLFTPSLALGYAIGRIGCFLNGCCYGIPTEAGWGVLTHYAPGLRHPTQLYATAANLLIFAALWRLRRRKRFDGYLFLLYLIMYSVYRFGNEFFRESFGPPGFLTTAQIASLAIIVASLVLIRVFNSRRNDSKELPGEIRDGDPTAKSGQ